jgi:hypothetical protein
VVLVALAVITTASPAQRSGVLNSVTLPHPYYVRELYLPQLTTGPSAVTWSPDGADVIYSMGGSLWRQRVGSDTARQVTDGPGYDYQPDWSSDGRFVVFATRTTDDIQLRVLSLATGETSVLVDHGVHVEPRLSPTGDRVAWVGLGDRAHVYVAAFQDGRLGSAVRVTPDHDSGLPRYYYSRWDHYLSPAWAPDGRSLVLVSNRGKVWGTGGLWRLPLGGGAADAGLMRLVRDEETNWKARPDVAPGGTRVVWSSYAGRQWHQLFLTTIDGGEPFQLTFGEFDATAARWSRDGRRIAYVSNERGNTSLWILDVPGGARREVVAGYRQYLRPHGSLRIAVTDAATGRTLPARVSVRGADGRHHAPDAAWSHADDAFDRRARPFEFTYFHSDGPQTVSLPSGEAWIEVMRGTEFDPVSRRVRVRAGEITSVRVPLRRLDDPGARGWIAGDLHVHMNYGGTYRNTPARLVRQARAEGLRVVENLIVNKESRIPDVGYFSGALDPASTADVLLKHDQEFHTSFWGHTGLLGLPAHLVLPDYAGYANTAAASLAPMNSEVMRQARAQGGIAGYVHPFDASPAPADTARALTNAFPVDLALGLVDYYEALGFVDDFMATQRVWYAALNCGFRIPAGAGTDAMANYASLRGPVGMNRVYARVRGPLTHRAFLDALRAGRTFVTNAPLLQLSVNGVEPGGEVERSAAPLRVNVRMRSMTPIDHLEIVTRGRVVHDVPLSGDRRTADATFDVRAAEGGWMLLRAWSDSAQHPVLDLRPFGTTSPVYLRWGSGAAPDEARYFLAWIDRLSAAVERFTGWNDEAERRSTLTTILDARGRMARACGAVP